MKKRMKTLLGILLAILLIASPALAETGGAGYTPDEMVVLSRHNIRSPLSGSGSLLSDITPHEWFEWTSAPSELSLRGAMLETLMGQYFRLWLEDEGLFPENYQPEEGAVFLGRAAARGGCAGGEPCGIRHDGPGLHARADLHYG